MDLSQITYSVRDHIATITFNRPDSLNALTGTMIAELEAVLADAKQNNDVRVAILTGAGKGFCSGADSKGMSSADANDPRREAPMATHAADARHAGSLGVQRTPRAIAMFPKPIIACVNGPAIGAGMDTASMCDWRIASDKARFGMTHLKVGRISMDGGYFFLSRILGPAKTLELAWTNRIFGAEEALNMGYINKLAPHEELTAQTWEFASRLANGPSVAIELAKKFIYSAPVSSLEQHLEGMELAGAICWSTEDATEGPKALAEKREPRFKGR